MPDRNLSKIRDKDGVVELHWWTPNGQDRESGEFICKDKPTDEFGEAMQALRDEVVKYLELPEPWKENITITTVSLSADRANNLGVVISGSCRVSAGGFGLSTPRLRQPLTEEEAGPGTLTIDEWAKIANLATLAHSYREGDRTQRGLGIGDGGGSGENDGHGEPVEAVV